MGIVRMWLKALRTWGGMGPWASRYGGSEDGTLVTYAIIPARVGLEQAAIQLYT